MSENRFAKCATAQQVLMAYYPTASQNPGDWAAGAGSAVLTAEALSRIRELTPPPVVSEEARERAEIRLGHWLRERGVSTSGIGDVLDRIIDALGYTPAPPQDDDDARYVCDDCGSSFSFYSVETMAEFATEHVRRCKPPVSPPVVEMDAESVRLLIERVGDLIEPGERMTFKRDDETVTLYRGNALGLVLRIGGDQ